MSLTNDGKVPGRKRKVNPALLLGGSPNVGKGSEDEENVLADDFAANTKPVSRFGLRAGSQDSGSASSGSEEVDGGSGSGDAGKESSMVPVPESKGGLPFPSKPVKEVDGGLPFPKKVSDGNKLNVVKPPTVKAEADVEVVRKPTPSFMLPGESRPSRKPVKKNVVEGEIVDELGLEGSVSFKKTSGSKDAGDSPVFPSKLVKEVSEVRGGSEVVERSEAVSEAVGEGSEVTGDETVQTTSVESEELFDLAPHVEEEVVSRPTRKPVPGFMLPGESRPSRKPVKEVVNPVEEGERSEVEDVENVSGLDVSDIKPVGRNRSKNVNPLLSTGEREAGKPVARPGFFLDTDKIPAKRPVDFARNKPATEPVADVADVPVVPEVAPNPVRKKSRYVSKVEANVEVDDWTEESEGTSAGLGGEVDARYTEPQYGRGFHLTERDIIFMRFLARYRYAYVDQLARLVDSIPRNVVNRLRVLEKRGFLRREALTDRQYLWTVRKAGLLLADSSFREIKKGTLSYATIAHTIGLGSLGVEFEREVGGKDLLGEGKGIEGYQVPHNRWKLGIRDNPEGMVPGEMTVTEREIRQGQMRWRGGRSYKELRELVDSAVADPDAPELEEGMEGLFVVYGPGGKGGEHVPDLVVTRGRDEFGNPNHIAIELELTQKTPTEWRKILRNYRDNGAMYGKVYYFTHKKSIGTALMRLAEEEGFGDKLVIRRYIPSNSQIPFWG